MSTLIKYFEEHTELYPYFANDRSFVQWIRWKPDIANDIEMGRNPVEKIIKLKSGWKWQKNLN